MPLVEFDEDSHRYYLEGRELVSVTTVLSALGLYNFGYADEVDRQRGEAVHHACWLHGRGRYQESTTHEVIVPFVRAWDRFVADQGYESLGGEEALGSKVLGYAGKPDNWGMVRGELWLPDIKTGTRPAAVPLQLAAYDMLLKEIGIEVKKRRCIELHKDGTYTILDRYKGQSYDLPKWRAGWMSCLNTYNLRKELTGR